MHETLVLAVRASHDERVEKRPHSVAPGMARCGRDGPHVSIGGQLTACISAERLRTNEYLEGDVAVEAGRVSSRDDLTELVGTHSRSLASQTVEETP